MTRRVAVNEAGYRIGETHHNATLSELLVLRLRNLRERCLPQPSYRELSIQFGLSVNTVKKICNYERRCQAVARMKLERAHGEQEESERPALTAWHRAIEGEAQGNRPST